MLNIPSGTLETGSENSNCTRLPCFDKILENLNELVLSRHKNIIYFAPSSGASRQVTSFVILVLLWRMYNYRSIYGSSKTLLGHLNLVNQATDFRFLECDLTKSYFAAACLYCYLIMKHSRSSFNYAFWLYLLNMRLFVSWSKPSAAASLLSSESI